MTNEELDAKVLQAIKGGAKRFVDIDIIIPGASHREKDRSLQRLRRAGLVKYTPATGWSAS